MILFDIAHAIAVTIIAFGLLTVVPRHLLAESQLMLDALRVADVLPHEAFLVNVSVFYTSPRHLPMHLVIACIGEPLEIILKNQLDSQKLPTRETSKKQCKLCTKL